MVTKLKITKNMSIYGTDDSKLGDVKQVVVDPSTSEITHLIVEQGFIFTTDKVLPMEFIDRQIDGSLYVDRPVSALDLRDYEESFYVKEDDPEVVIDEDEVHVPTSVFYYPPLVGRHEGYYWGMPGRYAGDPIRLVRRVNLPEDSLVIEKGMNVYSKDQDHVGDVYSVHVDDDTNRITHFIVSQGLLFQDYKLIPTFWIEEVSDRGLHVAVETKQLEKLPAFETDTA